MPIEAIGAATSHFSTCKLGEGQASGVARDIPGHTLPTALPSGARLRLPGRPIYRSCKYGSALLYHILI